LPLRTAVDKSTAIPDQTRTPLRTIVEGAIQGDWTAWNEIITRFGPLVLHTAGRTGLSSADAADVAQLTWLLLWEHGHQIREPEHLGAWLVAAARREAVRVSKASRRAVPCADPEYYGHNPPGSHDVYPIEGDYDGVLRQALDRLPVRYRALLMLMTSDLCLSYAEIADWMSMPIGSIGPMRRRALSMLVNTPEFRSGRIPRPLSERRRGRAESLAA
jgi:RNA polymerase sigma factor (sigma-70 family)